MSRLPRSSLIAGGITLLVAMLAIRQPAPATQGRNPHVDPALMSAGCIACHRSHGVSGSPMLPGSQKSVCLSCHGSSAALGQMVMAGLVSGIAQPPFLSAVLAQPYTHPISDAAFSRHEPGAVTCTSCHSAHRSSTDAAPGAITAPGRRISPVNPARFEYELCGSCHEAGGGGVSTLVDIGRLLRPTNRSFHPVKAPSADGSRTIIPSLAGREVSCSNCHGNSNPTGPRGPHGSTVAFLLRSNYNTVDGASESSTEYALCYSCHVRQDVLENSSFEEHKKHIVDERTSCATCHDGHGSVTNRGLIRFGEASTRGGVFPSTETGRLEFNSTGPGSGECYLTCHGEDHKPLRY